ncbi:uncharacterized protein LOC117188615 [Drosophila miranda]|uniref:uncharacterized protein LOC117188615 n=1 Tax=Drosophila miranda TaxID=7229 RepID=UPI00143F8A6F|nr:uncharacterized protein LOC117188615 [Drosophila miranda]
MTGLDTLVASMELHNACTSLDPPLTLDERAVSISYNIETDISEKIIETSHLITSTMSPDIGGIQCGGNPGETAYYVQYYTDYFTATIAKIKNSGDTKLTEANSEAVALSAIQRKQEKNKFIESTTRAAAQCSKCE